MIESERTKNLDSEMLKEQKKCTTIVSDTKNSDGSWGLSCKISISEKYKTLYMMKHYGASNDHLNLG